MIVLDGLLLGDTFADECPKTSFLFRFADANFPLLAASLLVVFFPVGILEGLLLIVTSGSLSLSSEVSALSLAP